MRMGQWRRASRVGDKVGMLSDGARRRTIGSSDRPRRHTTSHPVLLLHRDISRRGNDDVVDDIDIHHRGARTRSGGHGFSALGRRELLGILQRRALSLGADVVFEREAPSLEELLGCADLVVGADGLHSAVRRLALSGTRNEIRREAATECLRFLLATLGEESV